MTKNLIILTPFILSALLSCSKPADKAATDAKPAEQAIPAGVTVASISVPTTICESCEKTITNAVTKVDGVTDCKVDSKAHVAKVQFIAAKTNLNAIEHTIAKAGYTADAVERDSAGYANLEECCKK